MIFFALALSWVKELSEKLTVDKSKLSIDYSIGRGERRKISHKIMFDGLDTGPALIDLTSRNQDLMQKFISKKLNGDKWLTIKPKSDYKSAQAYDIQDHNEIKRLTSNILDGLFGKSNWDKIQHFDPLKNNLFEFSKSESRKIRLSLSPDRVKFMDISD